MGHHTDPSDPQQLLVKNIEAGIKSFSEASKEYIAAVRGVDIALERLAIALRQLSIGDDVPQILRNRIENFGAAVATHHHNSTIVNNNNNNASKTNRKSSTSNININNNNNNNNNINNGAYTLAPYMNDFSQDISTATEDLKTLTRVARKRLDSRDEAVIKYNNTRVEAEKIAAADVKKNRNSAENPKYIKKIQKRDVKRSEAEKSGEELQKSCELLMRRRGEVISRVIQSIATHSAQYWSGVAKVMEAGS